MTNLTSLNEIEGNERIDPPGIDRSFALATLLALVVVAGPTSLAAQDPEDTSFDDELVVTAARIEQRIEDVPAHLTVLSDELDNSAGVTMDDVLRQVPGFSLFRRSSSMVSHPTSQGVSLRGIGPSGVSRTLVMLDGVALNDPFGGWIYWSRVPRDLVTRVEVVRGGGSSVWGSSALGGVVNLFTSTPEKTTGSVHLRAGERGLLAAEGSAAGVRDRASYSAFGDLFQTDGYPVIRADQRGTIDVPAYSEHWTLGARGRLQLSDHSSVELRLETFDEERGNGTPYTGNDTQTDSVVLRGQWLAAGEWLWSVGWQDQEFSSRFSGVADDRNSENPALNQFLVPSESIDGSLQWLGGEIEGSVKQRLTAGADLRDVDGQTNEQFFFTDAFTRQREAGGGQQVGGVFLQDSLELTRVRFDLGVRVDRFESDSGFRLEKELSDGSLRLREDFPDRSETEVSPRAGVVFEAAEDHRIFASLYRSFRAPTINEMYRPFRVGDDITAANALLVPEVLTGAEVGWRYREGSTDLSIGLFHNRIDDAVSNVTIGFGPGAVDPCGFTPGGGTCRQRQNLEEVRIQGLELDAGRRFGQNLRVRLSYLYSDTEVIEARNSPVLEGLRLAQVPEHQVSLRGDWQAAVDLGLVVRGFSKQFDDDLNTREMNDGLLVDLFVGRDFGTAWTLFAGIENLFDEEIEAGIRGDGLVTIGAPRLAHLGIRLHLGH